jgi:hypothetical protein
MGDAEDAKGFNTEQRASLDARQVDRDRTLEAMHELEAALAAAAPGREDRWRNAVLETLGVLEAATSEEADNAERPDSLLSDIARTQPRLRNRVRGLRLQYRQLREGITGLSRELHGQGATTIDFADVRQRLSWVLTALRHQRARESDLIYEAYYEAFRTELAAEGESGSGSTGP